MGGARVDPATSQSAEGEPGQRVGSSTGVLGAIDTAVLTLRFENGAFATVDNSRKAVYGYDQRVELLGCVMGRLQSGALVDMSSCGSAIPSCDSEIRVFCTKAIIRMGIWGERLELQRAGEAQLQPVSVTPSPGAWEQFVAIRSGRMANPCPAEIGLRMARLWDAVKASAAQKGLPVRLG